MPGGAGERSTTATVDAPRRRWSSARARTRRRSSTRRTCTLCSSSRTRGKAPSAASAARSGHGHLRLLCFGVFKASPVPVVAVRRPATRRWATQRERACGGVRRVDRSSGRRGMIPKRQRLPVTRYAQTTGRGRPGGPSAGPPGSSGSACPVLLRSPDLADWPRPVVEGSAEEGRPAVSSRSRRRACPKRRRSHERPRVSRTGGSPGRSVRPGWLRLPGGGAVAPFVLVVCADWQTTGAGQPAVRARASTGS